MKTLALLAALTAPLPLLAEPDPANWPAVLEEADRR
jgi:hypothetical protein